MPLSGVQATFIHSNDERHSALHSLRPGTHGL